MFVVQNSLTKGNDGERERDINLSAFLLIISFRYSNKKRLVDGSKESVWRGNSSYYYYVRRTVFG